LKPTLSPHLQQLPPLSIHQPVTTARMSLLFLRTCCIGGQARVAALQASRPGGAVGVQPRPGARTRVWRGVASGTRPTVPKVGGGTVGVDESRADLVASHR